VSWFDRDESRRIVEFIRDGGLEKSRQRQITELEDRQRELQRTQAVGGGFDLPETPINPKYEAWELGISAAAAFLKTLFK
jgi:hypothetical protein